MLLAAFWTLWLNFGRFGFDFGSFFIILQPLLVRTLSSLGPQAELLPQATEIDLESPLGSKFSILEAFGAMQKYDEFLMRFWRPKN